MENKINIAEILKECPKGMELDCTIWDNVVFDHIDTTSNYPIYIKKMGGELEYLTEDGHFNFDCDAKCVIFPKGKTTWEGFHRPFEDGDIITTNRGNICIYKGPMYYNKNLTDFYCGYRITDRAFVLKQFKDKHFGNINECRFATKEEKQKLFEAIKDNGYRWNVETMTLEKLPKFKVGDKIKLKGGDQFGIIKQVSDCFYTINCKNNTHYWSIAKQDDWELVPSKFDINTLKPFDKVLVRDSHRQIWTADFFSHNIKESFGGYRFACVGHCWHQCIPYEGNQHLLGTTDDCDDFYKTWE